VSVVKVEYTNYADSIKKALNAIGAAKILSEQTAIIIKPNLMGLEPPPVTTPVACCDAVLEYIRTCSDATVVVAEGCRDPHMRTREVFIELGYADWAAEKGIHLIDLNDTPLEWRENTDCEMFPQISLPEIAFTHYIISVPVLKAHPLATMTGTLKNMMGFAPPRYHKEKNFACWKKEVFSENLQQAIVDLNRYRTPDLTVMDASIGLAESHLGGPRCDPPIGKILASFDPIALDRVAAGLLGLNWMQIEYLNDEIEEYCCY
jgi:uncharacterized protein (DUF362 family)